MLDDVDVLRVTLREIHDRCLVHEPMVTVEAESGIGGEADLLRLSPDREACRRTCRESVVPTSFAQPLRGDADAANGPAHGRLRRPVTQQRRTQCPITTT
jgi:hypothetical protein